MRCPSAAVVVLAAIGLAATLSACGESRAPADGVLIRTAIGGTGEFVLARGTEIPPPDDDRLVGVIETLAAAAATAPALPPATVDYPLADSVFPPGFVPPTFLWHDDTAGVDAWLVRIDCAEGEPILALTAGDPPEQGRIDLRAIGKNNEIYEPTPYQASAHAWKPSRPVWDEVQRRSVATPATVTFQGFATDAATRLLSAGAVRISTSQDEVGAPIFYRDVPLMPAVGERDGVIRPLGNVAIPLIEWRLKDVTRTDSRIVLTSMPTCANCHSFSLDGKTLGMDVDGPTGDKGAYAIAPLAKETVIGADQVISWNSYSGRIEGQKTIGFLSRIAPDGKHALTTLNESLYVENYTDYKFVQVFYPTRGIIAWYSVESGAMKSLPGADDPRYVHCNPVWTPDGKTVVFSRTDACDPYPEGRPRARFPNDPNEVPIRYDLYRVPFEDGRGGEPEPIPGASANGMSNTFPKVSPDGRWLVWTKCRNGQLLRPDGKLWIVPMAGGEPREMRCNTPLMNSWHSFSPNGRWLVFSSKSNRPYTQMFLTHIDENGNDTPAILIPDATAANRAVNLPEFVNRPYDSLVDIFVPVVNHHPHFEQGSLLMDQGRFAEALPFLEKTVEIDPGFSRGRVNLAFTLSQLGERERAKEHYRRALEIDPSDTFARGGLAFVSDEIGIERDDAALARIARRVDNAPDDVDAHRELGLALARRAETDEAIVLLMGVLKDRPDDVLVSRTLAQMLLGGGYVEQALRYLERAVELDPDDVESQTLWVWQLAAGREHAVRDGKKAVRIAERLCERTERLRVGPLDALAAAYAEVARFDDAIATATAAQRLAEEQGSKTLARGIRRRIEQYREGRPWHD